MEFNIENTKYVALKPKGFPEYIWFEKDNLHVLEAEDGDWFQGEGGWSKDGVLTHLKCRCDEIVGLICSEELLY